MRKLHRLISTTFSVLLAAAAFTGCHHDEGGAVATTTAADVTQLDTAIRSGDTQTVDHLLTAKPDTVNTKDSDGKTPLEVAGEKADNKMVTIIKDHGGHE